MTLNHKGPVVNCRDGGSVLCLQIGGVGGGHKVLAMLQGSFNMGV